MTGWGHRVGVSIGCLAAVLVAGPSSSQAVRTEAEVVSAVRTHSLDLQGVAAGTAARAEGPDQVRWPFPMLEVMPMAGMILDGDPGAQVMVRQAVPWPGRLSAERAGRAHLADAAAFERDALELDLVAAARSVYARLWGIQEQAVRIQEYITQLGLFREAALAQYRAGRGPQQAVLGIQVEAEILTQRLEALQEDRAGLAARLDALSGRGLRLDPADRLTPPSSLPARADVASLSRRLADHPSVEAARAMRNAEESGLAARRTALRPDFTLGVNLNLSRMAFDRMYGQEPVMPALGVMVPLWRRGVRAEVREAEHRVRQRELETAAARARLEAELEDVALQIERVGARIARYEDRLRPQIRQTLEASLAGYQAGTTRFLELLDAQRMALDVEVDLIMARVQAAELAARLDTAVGRVPAGTEQDDER
jgi:outer membrane protein, heavy metal efflux system